MNFLINNKNIKYKNLDEETNSVIKRTFNLALLEYDVIDFIDNMPENSVFYDLGACIGVFSLYASSLGHSVCAFEPDIINYNIFKEATILNNFNVNILNVAINDGSKEHETLVVETKINHSHHRILKTEEFSGATYLKDKIFSSENKKEIQVKATSIDDFILKNYNLFPTHLKVDIDGSEILFLRGAEKTLSDNRLKKIIFELDKESDRYLEIIYFLNKFNFLIEKEFFIPHGGKSLYNIVFSRK
jgi:FkbM family methyltransferase